MAEDHLRFRCYQCNQLLGVSSRKAGTVISCPRCAAELKVPRPEEQTVTADASRSGYSVTPESGVPVSSSAPTSKSGGNALPSFMAEIAAAIPDNLATLRPEDIRVEAEFVDLVITTSEGIVPPAPAADEPRFEKRPGAPVEVEAYFAQTPPPAELPPVVPAEPRSVDPPVDPAIEAVLPAINIETPTLLPPGRHLQAVSEVILQPATVLAWSLLVLLALPMAFLAGLLIGHFVWK
jgi:phage FluMu protein Com